MTSGDAEADAARALWHEYGVRLPTAEEVLAQKRRENPPRTKRPSDFSDRQPTRLEHGQTVNADGYAFALNDAIDGEP